MLYQIGEQVEMGEMIALSVNKSCLIPFYFNGEKQYALARNGGRLKIGQKTIYFKTVADPIDSIDSIPH